MRSRLFVFINTNCKISNLLFYELFYFDMTSYTIFSVTLSLPEWFTCWPLCLCLKLSLTKHQQETSPSHPNLESIYWPASYDHKQTESRAIHNNNCLNVSYMSWQLLCKRRCAVIAEEIKNRFFWNQRNWLSDWCTQSFHLFSFSHTKTLRDWTADVLVNLWSNLFDWGCSKFMYLKQMDCWRKYLLRKFSLVHIFQFKTGVLLV